MTSLTPGVTRRRRRAGSRPPPRASRTDQDPARGRTSATTTPGDERGGESGDDAHRRDHGRDGGGAEVLPRGPREDERDTRQRGVEAWEIVGCARIAFVLHGLEGGE